MLAPVPGLNRDACQSGKITTFVLPNFLNSNYMVPLHTFKIDFIDTSGVSEQEFRELIALSLSHLEAFATALRSRSSFSVFYYQPNDAVWNPKGWSARCILMISVGKPRVHPMLHLFELVINQIETDVPPYIDIVPDIGRFEFQDS